MKHLKRLLVALGLPLLSACTVGPDALRPEPPAIAQYTVGAVPAQTASSGFAFGVAQTFDPATTVRADWWRMLGSPKLDRLIELALEKNPSLLAAQATLRQAQETYSARAGSTLYPQLGANLSDQRQQLNGAIQGQPDNTNLFSLYNASVNVSYNFDIFGGNRRVLEALASRAEYQQYQLAGARLTLAANVATSAITQAKLAGQIQANEVSLKAQEEQLIVANHRLRLGQTSEDDVFALQTEIEQTRAGIPVLRTRWEQSVHLLAVLVGQSPGQAGLPHFTLEDFTIPTHLPLVVPSELVRRRPDIQSSEALMRATNAEYGAALARMYPQLTLSGSAGSLALTTGTLFGSGTLFWQILGQLTQPLFNPGLPAESRAALAAFEAAASNYQVVVLESLRNVADVLRALENDAQTLNAQSRANAAASALLLSVQRQYTYGTASYLQLLIAQMQAQRTQFDLVAAQSQRLSDTVALYQAMGGGILNFRE